jgi:hypothetical protein
MHPGSQSVLYYYWVVVNCSFECVCTVDCVGQAVELRRDYTSTDFPTFNQILDVPLSSWWELDGNRKQELTD